MTKTEVDGVPTVVSALPSDVLEATLTFQVGVADETLADRGVCHAVEHLALYATRHTLASVEGHVGLDRTTFTARGTGDQVASFLRRLCRVLAHLRVNHLAVEKGVLETEGEFGIVPAAAMLYTRRFGARYAGSAAWPTPPPTHLRSERVSAFAHTWFVSGNALLELSGQVPAHLTLPLRDAPSPRGRLPQGRLAERPQVLEDDDAVWPGAGVLLRLPPSDAALTGDVLTELLTDRVEHVARSRRGASYAIDHQRVPAADGWDVVVSADAHTDRARVVAEAVRDVVRDLAEHGPTQRELSRLQAKVAHTHDVEGPESFVARRVARDLAAGVPQGEPADLASVLGLTTTDLRDALRRAAAGAVYYAHREVLDVFDGHAQRVPRCDLVADQPAGRAARPRRPFRLLSSDARGTRLVETATGLALVEPEGTHVVAWDDVVAVGRDEFSTHVLGGNGCVVTVDRFLFAGARRLPRLVRERVPAELFYDLPPDTRD